MEMDHTLAPAGAWCFPRGHRFRPRGLRRRLAALGISGSHRWQCVRSRCSATFACSGWFNGPGIGAFRRGKGGGCAGGSSRRPGRSRRSTRLRPWSGAARRIGVRDAQRPRRAFGDQCHSGSHEIKALLDTPRRSGSLPARPAGSTRSALDRSHPLPAKVGHLALGLGWLPAMSAARLLANCQVAARKRR